MQTAETQFLTYLSEQSLIPQVINFEDSQGWGYGNFAGTDGDYDSSHVDSSVISFVSALYSQSGKGCIPIRMPLEVLYILETPP